MFRAAFSFSPFLQWNSHCENLRSFKVRFSLTVFPKNRNPKDCLCSFHSILTVRIRDWVSSEDSTQNANDFKNLFLFFICIMEFSLWESCTVKIYAFLPLEVCNTRMLNSHSENFVFFQFTFLKHLQSRKKSRCLLIWLLWWILSVRIMHLSSSRDGTQNAIVFL